MFDECGLELWPEMTTRGYFCPNQQKILILFCTTFSPRYKNVILSVSLPEVAECTTNAAGENSAVGGLLSRWRCTTVAAIEESPVGQSIIDSNNNKLREIG